MGRKVRIVSEYSVNPVQINLSEIEPGTELKREDRVNIDHKGNVTVYTHQDTREQLEADAISYVVDNVTTYEETRHKLIGEIKNWLNRQEAITEREQTDKWQHLAYGNELLEADKMALQDSVAELTTERDRLKKRLEHQATYIAGVEDELCRYKLQLVRNEKDFDKLTAERDDLRCTTEELKKRNDELLESRAYWINQVMSVYERFYLHDGCVPANVCSMVITKIDELEAERDKLRETIDGIEHGQEMLDLRSHIHERDKQIAELIAERDHLQAAVDALKHDCEETTELTVIDDRLTAAQAREIKMKSDDRWIQKESEDIVRNFLYKVRKSSERNSSFCILDLPICSVEVRRRILKELSELGYNYKQQHWWDKDKYIVSW